MCHEMLDLEELKMIDEITGDISLEDIDEEFDLDDYDEDENDYDEFDLDDDY